MDSPTLNIETTSVSFETNSKTLVYSQNTVLCHCFSTVSDVLELDLTGNGSQMQSKVYLHLIRATTHSFRVIFRVAFQVGNG
jgi:hypothetical protein